MVQTVIPARMTVSMRKEIFSQPMSNDCCSSKTPNHALGHPILIIRFIHTLYAFGSLPDLTFTVTDKAEVAAVAALAESLGADEINIV